MLSLSSLLNPAPPGPTVRNRFPPSPALPSPVDSSPEDSAFPDRSAIPKHKMPKDAAVFTKSKPKGAINFRPYENLDESSLRLVRKFQVYPLGKIQEYSRHIPYNSGKKDFYEKTGRESFEVFQYVFKVPGSDTEYAVMWDYNVGLVRMTPFFKCCNYPKTTPAKMLNLNPGLKEITHSITGGSIMAQGYWMPYQCAKAVCATFCYNISGALIPIFGPDFPALCTPAEAPEYSRMVIDPAIIMRSTRDAEYYRRLYSNEANQDSEGRGETGNSSPKHDRRVFRSPHDDSSRRHRMRKTCITTATGDNSPYGTDTEGEISPITDRSRTAREPRYHHLQRYHHSPLPSIMPPLRSSQSSNGHSSGWTPANLLQPHHNPPPSRLEHQPAGPSPWLSAIPRFTTTAHLQEPSYPSMSSIQRHPRLHSSAANLLNQHRGSMHTNSNSYSFTYHPSASHRQLPSPSDPPPHYFSQQQIHPLSRTKRTAAQIDGDISPVDRQRMKTSTSDSHAYITDKASHRESGSPRSTREDEKIGGGSGTSGGNGNAAGGADKKAALLLMNLSVRDHYHHHHHPSSFWKSVGKSVTVESPTMKNGDDNDNNSSRSCCKNKSLTARCSSMNGDDTSGDIEVVGASSTTAGNHKLTCPGVEAAFEKMTPLESMFPRIKRIRFNSM